MKKIVALFLGLCLTVGMTGCSIEFQGIAEKQENISFTIQADYGRHVMDKDNVGYVTYLLDYSLPFFNSEEYGIKFILGMKINMTYTGDLTILDCYLGRVDRRYFDIVDITYENPNIYEYEMRANESGEKTLMPVSDAKFDGEYTTEYVITENRRFKTLNEVEAGDKFTS